MGWHDQELASNGVHKRHEGKALHRIQQAFSWFLKHLLLFHGSGQLSS